MAAASPGRSASSSIRIFGAPDARDFALGLGRTLQIVNILRDIDEDAALERIYVPLSRLAKLGIEDGPAPVLVGDPRFARACEVLAEEAKEGFARARRALDHLDRAHPQTRHPDDGRLSPDLRPPADPRLDRAPGSSPASSPGDRLQLLEPRHEARVKSALHPYRRRRHRRPERRTRRHAAGRERRALRGCAHRPAAAAARSIRPGGITHDNGTHVLFTGNRAATALLERDRRARGLDRTRARRLSGLRRAKRTPHASSACRPGHGSARACAPTGSRAGDS